MADKDVKNLASQLSSLKKEAVVDIEWKYTLRQTLLIKSRTQSMAKIYEEKLADDLGFFGFLKSWQQPRPLVPAMVFSGILFSFFGLSFGTVWAAQSSLPGDLLFPVKLATERTQLIAKDNADEKARFQIEIANRRVGELVAIASNQNDDGKKAEQIEQAVLEVEHQLAVVKNDLPKMENGTVAGRGAATVVEASNKLAVLEDTLNKVKNQLPEQSLAQKVNSAAKMADSVSTEALVLMAQGTDGNAKEAVLSKVEEKISKTEEKLKTVDEKVVAASSQKDAKNSFKGSNSLIAISADLVREQSEKAKVILNKAKESLKKDDLVTAIETIKTAKEIVASAENLASDMEKQKAIAGGNPDEKTASSTSPLLAPKKAISAPTTETGGNPAGAASDSVNPENKQPDSPGNALPVLEGAMDAVASAGVIIVPSLKFSRD